MENEKRYPGDELAVSVHDKRGVILLSGGIDSAVGVELAMRNGWELAALTIDYGQRHSSELIAARKIAAEYKLEHVVAKIDVANLLPSPLTTLKKPEADPDDPERSEFYVPGRNTIFLSLALGFAEARGIQSIFIGATLEDHIAFRDCREIFLSMFEKAAQFGTGKKIRVRAPLLKMRKLDVVRCGIETGAPLHLTVSCYYADGETHCGKCPACEIRRQAFADLAKERPGTEDPTEYGGEGGN